MLWILRRGCLTPCFRVNFSTLCVCRPKLGSPSFKWMLILFSVLRQPPEKWICFDLWSNADFCFGLSVSSREQRALTREKLLIRDQICWCKCIKKYLMNINRQILTTSWWKTLIRPSSLSVSLVSHLKFGSPGIRVYRWDGSLSHRASAPEMKHIWNNRTGSDFLKFMPCPRHIKGLTCTSLVLCLNLELSHMSQHVYKRKGRSLKQELLGTWVRSDSEN